MQGKVILFKGNFEIPRTHIRYSTTHIMAFRRIDIDQYDEDIYTEDEILADAESGRSVDEINSIVDARATEVRNLLTR